MYKGTETNIGKELVRLGYALEDISDNRATLNGSSSSINSATSSSSISKAETPLYPSSLTAPVQEIKPNAAPATSQLNNEDAKLNAILDNTKNTNFKHKNGNTRNHTNLFLASEQENVQQQPQQNVNGKLSEFQPN